MLRNLVTDEIRLSKSDIAEILLKKSVTTSVVFLVLALISFAISFSIPLIFAENLAYAIRITSVVTIVLAVLCYVADIVRTLLSIALARIRIDSATVSASVVISISDIATVLTYFIIAAPMPGI